MNAKFSVELQFKIPSNDWKKNDLRSIRAHYEQLSEFERGRIIRLKEAEIRQIGESLVIRVQKIRPLEDADKNGWTVPDFSVMMVAVDLGPRQIGRIDCL
ncbi:hypothetical protein TNCV_4292301 [Trichonephila clavipes]|uniref:Uncharacterized protein n=1 Tax=Trichonephila clavipes TaxID=2585209 RepID=A0A8X6RPN7_TRICX|nr:hypothetical protein TNCV_4292301 [Trichonephila clavipes]